MASPRVDGFNFQFPATMVLRCSVSEVEIEEDDESEDFFHDPMPYRLGGGAAMAVTALELDDPDAGNWAVIDDSSSLHGWVRPSERPISP